MLNAPVLLKPMSNPISVMDPDRWINLCVLDAPTNVIAMRRRSKGLFEGPTVVLRAKARKLRQLRKGYLLSHMPFNKGGDLALLPSAKAATGIRFRAEHVTILMRELLHEHDCECLRIESGRSWLSIALLSLSAVDQSMESSNSSREILSLTLSSDGICCTTGSK